MSILEEIRNQPLWAREVMFVFSIVITFSLVGMAWFKSFQTNIYALNHPGESIEDQRYYAEGEGSGIGLNALIGEGFTYLKGSVYDILNIERTDSVDAKPKSVYPLPIAEDRVK